MKFGAVWLLLAAGCGLEPADPGSFYEYAKADLRGEPGDIVRSDPFPGAPEGAKAWRILYLSTGMSGEPIAVSGIVMAPDGPADSPRKVVAWAHPTTGVAARCAPSLDDRFFATVPGLGQLLQDGHVIAATDYPGLGAGEVHPYLVGPSEGRSVLDAVRAAVRLPGTGASEDFAVWGHSQGGHAALFAGQLAEAYAPELRLAGVAAAAPATDLSTLLHDDLSSKAGKVLGGYAMWSWHRVYGAPLEALLDPPAIAAMDRIAEDCLEGPIEGLVVAEREKAIDRDFLKADLTALEPWKSLLAANTPDPALSRAPLFIAQGSADQVVRPDVTVSYAGQACEAGASVRLDLRPGADHLKIVSETADEAAQWLSARLDGVPAPNDCASLPPPAGSD